MNTIMKKRVRKETSQGIKKFIQKARSHGGEIEEVTKKKHAEK